MVTLIVSGLEPPVVAQAEIVPCITDSRKSVYNMYGMFRTVEYLINPSMAKGRG